MRKENSKNGINNKNVTGKKLISFKFEQCRRNSNKTFLHYIHISNTYNKQI